MFLLDGAVVTSASDLTAASKCEFAFLRALDAKLGRIQAVDEQPDPMLERAARLGDAHEARVLARYRQTKRIVEIERPSPLTAETLATAASATERAFRNRADVVFQATFFDGGFVGFADFIVHVGDGVYEVQDTKLARSAKVTALLQLAAYADQLQRLGIPTDETVRLVLGDGSESEHRLSDILPVYLHRRDRLRRIVRERKAEAAAVAWGDPRYSICGRCAACDAEVQDRRDLLLVAGMRLTQRARLIDAGITTIEQLANSTAPVPGLADGTLATLRQQAAVQASPAVPGAPPRFELYNAPALAALPAPDPGDIYFDFEGDPLHTEGDTRRWGIDYLFGLVDREGSFVPFWAHDQAQERQALLRFLAFVDERRQRHPGLHIYHYAAYERTHLLSLAARHGVGEQAVDDLLRGNVLVDLYPLVRKSVRVGSRSYSLKKLEPLYMGSDLRESEVTTAGDSITAYAESRVLEATGEHDAAQRILDEIADYNRYDCLSTLRLHGWLLNLAATRGVFPGTITVPEKQFEPGPPSPTHAALLEIAGDPLAPHRSDGSVALALAAAAIDYHRRENKSFWWDHFARLIQPIDEWADTRDVFVIDAHSVERDWYREGKQRNERRLLRLSGQLAPGSKLKPRDMPYAVYEYPGPFLINGADPGARPYRQVTILDTLENGDILVEEPRSPEVEPYIDGPSALTPSPPPDAGSMVTAIAEWGQAIVDEHPDLPTDAALDILRREPPRLRSGPLARTGDAIGDVTVSLLDLDSSYLAVQGPPGTGKTYLASQVIVRLVRDHGWRVGVVAQSHAVVENVLDGIVAAGLPPALVAKVSQQPPEARSFTELGKEGHRAFAAANAATGFVLGGTAWDFSKPSRFPRHSLDLLVIDEAGQFSLGYTIAASVAARNLLLLGDPQQLPQVSQGTHPEPVDESALGWISDGHDVLPPELGYFLAESRRMHAAVTAPVSALSYENKLRSHPDAAARELRPAAAGHRIAPGLHAVAVEHTDNSTSSVEEADRVVEIVRSTLAQLWTNPSDGRVSSPITERDVIVVTPYNAQVGIVHDALVAVGLGRVRVGTVDKFQGQEAVVAIVTLAASSPAEVPRGMSFLLLKNRLNVAISRAQWAAFLLYSPTLVDYLPTSVAGVAELSAFLTLTASSPDQAD
jgi:predicted RecB family nuclease